jgi:phage repressor protein C with HTH and peptisase S24 domain
MSQTELADRSGVSQSTIANIESGRNEGSRHIVKIAEALNTNVNWLLFGQLPRIVYNVQTVSEDEQRADPNIRPDTLNGPIGVLPSALPDIWMDRSEVKPTGTKGQLEWRKAEGRALCLKTAVFPALDTHPSRCRVIAVPDDSMNPFVGMHDLFVIDLTRAAPRDGRVFAILFEGDLLIRQIFKQPGGALVLHAYNANFPDKFIAADQIHALEIIGEYVYRAGSARA